MFILYVDYNLSLSFLEAGWIDNLDYKEYNNKEGVVWSAPSQLYQVQGSMIISEMILVYIKWRGRSEVEK